MQKDFNLKKIVRLASPEAIGIYITLILTTLTFHYYQAENQQDDYIHKNIFLKYIYNAIGKLDLWSTDLRLNMQDPHQGSSDVAVLAVDDRSMKIIGRWPWPRDVMARAIEGAYQNGASIIASDIVWSEPSDPKLDKSFSRFLNKYKEKFILGNIFENISGLSKLPSGSGFQTACHDLILKNSPLEKLIVLQTTNPKILDRAIEKSNAELPEVFSENYFRLLINEEINVKAKLTKSNSKFERHEIENLVFNMKEDFCQNLFLNPSNEKDVISKSANENWQDIKRYDPSITFNTFESWVENYKKNQLLNAVPESLTGVLNLSQFIENSTNFGFFNATLDEDGSIRRTQLLIRAGSAYIPSIALQTYLVGTNQHIQIEIAPNKKLQGEKEIKKLTVVNSAGKRQFDIPVTSEGSMIINYAGPAQTFAHASIADLLDLKNPSILIWQLVYDRAKGWSKNVKSVSKKLFFKNKKLIVGVTAIGVYDLRVTPFDKNYPGG